MSSWKYLLSGVALVSATMATGCGTSPDEGNGPGTSEDPVDEPMEPVDEDPPDDREPTTMTPMMPMEPTEGARIALKAYEVCEEDADCSEEFSCVDLLGSRICSVTGCGDDESLCVVGETCVVSPAIAPDGVCAFSGTNQFCARYCRDPLVCNLDPECTTQGCCGDVGADGCPATCSDLDPMNCEISPQCPASCCGE